VAGAAAALRGALLGRTATRVAGSHREVVRHGARLTGHVIVAVESAGKHLLVRFGTTWAIGTRLGMHGSWRVERGGDRWTRSPGAARVVIDAADVRAVCCAAPTVQIAPGHLVDAAIEHLGPDAATPGFDEARAARRAAARPGPSSMSEVLTDQAVLAGVGNVFKSEILFLERLHPATPLAALDRDRLAAVFRRARWLLRGNGGSGPRSTTGDVRPGQRHWVYGRSGRPCRRCGTTVASGWIATRITYWRPRCQPISS
jgi:endonuclease-8